MKGPFHKGPPCWQKHRVHSPNNQIRDRGMRKETEAKKSLHFISSFFSSCNEKAEAKSHFKEDIN